MRQQDERDLRTLLREEAERHRPDRAAMWDRVAQGRAKEARPAFFVRMRPAAAAVAVAGVLVGVVGVRLADAGTEPDGAPVAAATTPARRSPTPHASAAPTPTDDEPTRPPAAESPPRTDPDDTTPTPKASASSGSTPKAPAGTKSGFLTSGGVLDPHSGVNWAQENVTLESTTTITALELTMTVALTAGVTESGKWCTVPNNLLTMTATVESGKLVYRFTLNQGATLTPGSYIFAAQFNHAAGERPLTGDNYAATASADAKDVEVSGGFTAQ